MMRVLVSVGALRNLLSDQQSLMELMKLLESIQYGNMDGYVTTTSLKQFLYEAGNSKGFKESIIIVYSLLEILKQCPDEERLLNQADFSTTSNIEFIEYSWAKNMKIGAIVTEDPKYFIEKTDLNILSIKQCLKRLGLEGNLSNSLATKYIQENDCQQNQEIVNLMQWFDERYYEVGWQAVQELVSPQRRPAFRNIETAKQERAKSIDLGLELDDRRVALIITVQEKDEKTVQVRSQIYPTGEAITLPPNLKMSVLTDTDTVLIEVIARSNDEFIQSEFDAERGDSFGIQVALGEVSLTEKFRV